MTSSIFLQMRTVFYAVQKLNLNVPLESNLKTKTCFYFKFVTRYQTSALEDNSVLLHSYNSVQPRVSSVLTATT